MTPSPESDRATLIRRVSLDLTGIPPTPTELESFISNKDPQAYEHTVDRLLESPHYGERWGRHWLDLARFGESDGFERNNTRNNLWPYRDWVIKAINDDMPYDEFVRMQIAGDILKPGDPVGQKSVGFLVAGLHNTVVGGSEFMKKTATENKISWQNEILTAGGTDTASIQRMTPGGSIAGAFSIPTRHIHQVIEMVHKKDVESCIELLKCCLLSMKNNNWEHKNEF